ncbi:phage portal protein [Hydrogenovibrio sp. 3SP14C1]|uniref:phage portal protein n=1 Tax=Hydrogenovibrio sp. 3SP14C1 TaxID=3038774 RepID=UPI0024175906|nr:phage portal protein [Hydrogenovibrio sp. 3SP14C1]MDG4811924.1 phage portal protein [Hydrogenovibrio sp. 3SP14C1]
MTQRLFVKAKTDVQTSYVFKADSQAYQASSTGRRLSNYSAPDLGPNSASLSEIDTLRNRSRSAVRNNPWINNGVRADVANEIGTGIVPRPKSPDKDFNKAIRELWNDWLYQADADGVANVYGLQELSARARRESGEVFIRQRKRKLKDGLIVPLQFQLLEADFCPSHYNGIASNGNEVIAGIEFDKIGKRAAYWMYRRHPADRITSFELNNLVRIPADQIQHHFIPSRPGQIRGEPQTIQGLVKAYHYDQYEDAEIERKKTRANYTGVIEKNFPDEDSGQWKYDPITGDPVSEDEAGQSYIDAEPGSFPSLLPGENINLFDGDATGNGYQEFTRQQLLGISAGIGVPYELVSGDYKDINDRIWRAIMNQYRRVIQQDQSLWTINQVCLGMWHAFVDMAVLSGKIAAPADFDVNRHLYLRVDYIPQAWEYINPLQDVSALLKAKDGGLDSRQHLTASRGRDVEDVDEQRAEDKRREENLGLDK